MNIKQLKTALPFAFKVNVAVMVHGLHGIGKSQSIKQYCDENGLEFVDRRLSQMESGDLLGLPDLSGDTTTFKTPDWLPRDPEWKGIIFLDEINRARQDVLQGVFQLVLDRQLGSYTLPVGAHVVTAVNPNTDNYQTTHIFDEALLDRFLHIKLEPTQDEYFQYMKSNSKYNRDFIEYLQANGDMIENSKLQGFSLDVKPSRRSNAKAAELYAQGMPEDIEREMIAGLIGLESAVAFHKWMVNNEVKPFTLDEILGDYNKIQEKVEKYSDQFAGRHDVINTTYGNIKTELQVIEKAAFTATEKENFLKFLFTTPKEIAHNFCQELLKDTSNKPSVNAFREDVILAPETDDFFGITPEIKKQLDELNAQILTAANNEANKKQE